MTMMNLEDIFSWLENVKMSRVLTRRSRHLAAGGHKLPYARHTDTCLELENGNWLHAFHSEVENAMNVRNKPLTI
jgi:hypothetical protein